MTFNTYVINLKNDHHRWANIKKNMIKHNIDLIRFEGINGNKDKLYKYKNHVHPICLKICARSVIGCGLSHIKLNKFIYEKDDNEFALVLEDDAFSNSKNLKKKIKNIVDNAPNNWDIITLYCQGICNNKKTYNSSNIFTGGMLSYLISKSGQYKIKNLKLINHIDTQIHSSPNMNIYNYQENIFYPQNVESNNKNESIKIYNIFDTLYNNCDSNILSHKPSYFMKYNIFYNPITKNTITSGEFVIIIILVIFLLILVIYKISIN